MIDSERITELEAEIGAEDLGMILAMFFEEAADTFAGIEAGLDAEGLGRAMHFLRSGALNLGLRGFATAAGTITGEQEIDPMAAADRLREVLNHTRKQLASKVGTTQGLDLNHSEGHDHGRSLCRPHSGNLV